MRMSDLGIGLDLVEQASPKGAIDSWLDEHPEEAVEFWAYVEGVLKNGYDMYPVMKKLIESLGGPPGSDTSIRRFVSGRLSKIEG